VQIFFESQKERFLLKQIITKIDTERRIWHNLLTMRGTDTTGRSSGCLISVFLEDLSTFFYYLDPDPDTQKTNEDRNT
jgi:hypothetical protein